MADKITKTSRVKDHLLAKKTITSWEAITLYRATRLSAIIFNLKKRGMNIISIPESKNIDGITEHYTVYKLAE